MTSPYRDTPVLVLGAAGFIGRWVARHLAAAGARLALAVRDPGEAGHVLERFGVAGRIVELDLADAARVAAVLRSLAPAVTFNLAGYGVDPAEREASAAHAINGLNVRVVSETLAELDAGPWAGNRLVHAGTALEYGPSSGPLDEDSPAEPTTLYGRSKLEGTRHLTDVCATRGLRGITARLFTVYGPGEHAGRLLPSLLDTRASGQPLRLSPGTQRRDFTYVEDVADGLLRLGLAAAPPGTVVNLATGRLTQVRVFAESAARLLGIPQDLLRFGALPPRPEETPHGPVCLDRLRHLLRWAPPTDVDEGILRTMAFESGPAPGRGPA